MTLDPWTEVVGTVVELEEDGNEGELVIEPPVEEVKIRGDLNLQSEVEIGDRVGALVLPDGEERIPRTRLLRSFSRCPPTGFPRM